MKELLKELCAMSGAPGYVTRSASVFRSISGLMRTR